MVHLSQLAARAVASRRCYFIYGSVDLPFQELPGKLKPGFLNVVIGCQAGKFFEPAGELPFAEEDLLRQQEGIELDSIFKRCFGCRFHLLQPVLIGRGCS
ncbi:MAG: hypothetical protein NXI26_24635 [bacterium]|nr:hypothetical protein [Phaeodactylibacter xiamenensis]MCR9055057.1 hypothetical protein [bacterium]